MGILRESYRCNKMTMDISPDDLIEFTELTSQPIILPENLTANVTKKIPYKVADFSTDVKAEGSGEGGAGAGRGGGAGAGAGGPAAAALGRRLLLAARAGDTPAVLDLMAQGAPFTTDWLGTSALHLAAGGAHAALCAVLLRAGVSRDARSKVERTPLHVAAHAGHAAAAAVLLRHGAPPDPRDLLRMTPLHWAAARGHAAVAALLLRAGADPAAVSKFRKTPPQLAREAGHRDVLRLLEDALRDRERLRERQREPTEAADARRPLSTDFVEIDRDSESGAAAPSGAAAAGEEGAGAALLRRHGITLLPPDDGGTVLSALRSGRSVVLSDAGKLMLKESGAPPAPAPAPPCPRPAAARGVVLKATPVRGPPEPGVKIFTLNNKRPAPAPAAAPAPAPPEPPVSDDARPPTTTSGLGELPAGGAPRPQRRLKYVQLPPPAKIALGGAGGGRQAVKIIMNKANFDKLLADAGCAAPATPAPAAPAPATPAELRAALAAAQARARRLQRELDACRARLALYEP